MKKKKTSKDPKKVLTTSNSSDLRNCNYDLIQRMRFMNADQHIAPEDSYTDGSNTFND